jgi:gliding motility-associated-like protein
MKKIPLLFILFFAMNCFAQLSKTHYIPPLTAQNNLVEDHYIYISTPNTAKVNLKIIPIGGNVISEEVSNTEPLRYFVGRGNNSHLFISKNNIGIVANKGYIIEAEDLVYVSVRVNASKNTDNTYNHAGGLVSKGNSALGTIFRLGGMLNPLYDNNLLNFASVLATENNTKITISDIPTGTKFSDGTTFTIPITINLNKNESYVLALENNDDGNPTSNSSKMIGALVKSDKPVVVNSGSFGGSNSTLLIRNSSGGFMPSGRDLGFDQIVSFEKTGKEYIFVKGIGTDEIERVLLVAQNPNTIIYLNGSTSPFGSPLNEGDFIAIDGSQFINGNLFITTSENVFAYQSIGGLAPGIQPNGLPNNPPANQNLFFVPPLNCATPNNVNNIPFIQSIGDVNFTGGINIITETDALVKINGGIITEAPVAIFGNPKFVRYTINRLFGNISVISEKQVYVSYFGTNGAATYGGYYSGFDLKPELTITKSASILGSCIPNIIIKTEFDEDYDYQWYKNNVAISADKNTFTPTEPGYYLVERSITSCNTSIKSYEIPVSNCPTDLDGDSVPDNVDLDNDNDGITNCEESFGDLNIDLTGTSIVKNTYANTFSSSTTKSPSTSSATVVGKSNGEFVSEVPIGKGNSIQYKINFNNPISINKPIAVALEYVNTDATDLIDSNAEFTIKSDIDKTITVLNPSNQLLIDTNYDGIFESGITEYSSFEIRFRLNSTTPLAAGTGKFSFQSYQTTSLTFLHKNLSENTNNIASFKLKLQCIPRDSDLDLSPDYLDTDADNDGILDSIEGNPNTVKASPTTDLNKDGIYDVFGTVTNTQDTDEDTIYDYLDLDSDNDGIKDEIETSADQDVDGIRNFRDFDSENDGCNDVIEAGFSDGDSDGKYGNSPIGVDQNGLIVGAPYSPPNTDYSTAAPIIITKQPLVSPTCLFQNASISITENGVNSYQWQLFNGTTWNNISNDSTYSGATTNTLTITNVTNAMQGYQFRVVLEKDGNSCGRISDATTLTVNALPVVNPSIELIQCDYYTFNLREKNNFISANAATETFTYYTSLIGAQTKNSNEKIVNPTAYTTNSTSVWVNVENTNGCTSTALLNLKVLSTQIQSFNKPFIACDDLVNGISTDTDGTAEFDFSSVTDYIYSQLPNSRSDYSIKYYPTLNDAVTEDETKEITNIKKYRNIPYGNSNDGQDIYVRIESISDNSCFGIGKYVKLIVNPKPNINTNEDGQDDTIICLKYTGEEKIVTLDAGLQNGIQSLDYNYKWTKDGNVLSTDKNYIVNKEGTYTVEVSYKETGCAKNRTINVTASEIATIDSIDIVDLSQINSITINTSGKGIYEYRLDSGLPQISNFFDNIEAGIHTIYIDDTKNGCGPITKEIAVLGIPKFFTPNNDNANELWNINGVNERFNSKSQIYIFDRYGKLLVQFPLPETGWAWNGTFNGAPLPSDDYWYSIKLEDGREIKGHFSLIR